jgi:POT family proton-dependent oligopeptide transporter
LALFSRLAPKAITAFTIGIYYLAFFAANKIVGVIGGWYSVMDTVQFWLLHVASATVGLAGFVLFKLLAAPRLMPAQTRSN